METNIIQHNKHLTSSYINTYLGQMLVISDENYLYLVEFTDRYKLEKKVQQICCKMNVEIIPGDSLPITMIKKELSLYFKGLLKKFTTPIKFLGSPFQQRAWQHLRNIPYGKTTNYQMQAISINNPTSFRAVANANGANKLAIIIPCHRVINKNGELGGYGGGVNKKLWLINHEKLYSM